MRSEIQRCEAHQLWTTRPDDLARNPRILLTLQPGDSITQQCSPPRVGGGANQTTKNISVPLKSQSTVSILSTSGCALQYQQN